MRLLCDHSAPARPLMDGLTRPNGAHRSAPMLLPRRLDPHQGAGRSAAL